MSTPPNRRIVAVSRPAPKEDLGVVSRGAEATLGRDHWRLPSSKTPGVSKLQGTFDQLDKTSWKMPVKSSPAADE